MRKIGIIAGNGQFPIIFAKKAKSKGFFISVAAHINETDPSIENFVDDIEWIHLGQIKRIIKTFKKNHITEAVMMGGIKKTKMFSDIKPDIKAISLITSMKNTHDDALLRGVADVLEKDGIQIKASTFMMPELLAQEGCWTKRKPSRSEKIDIDLGWHIAKEIGRLDIGQCVVVGGGSILAVEAIDGTDATILRGGKLGKGSEVITVKVCKPNQDIRFDIPAIGVQTILTMKEADVSALAIEAKKAIVFDKEEMIEYADKFNISILGI